MSKKLSAAVALTITFFLLSISIIYACPDVARGDLAPRHSLMNGGMPQETPCTQQKEDVCRFVRDRVLSIQPSPYKVSDVQQPVLLLLPVPLSIGIPQHIAISSTSSRWQTAFHSVFKIPLSLSSSVLRI